jgi:hypothetical protein
MVKTHEVTVVEDTEITPQRQKYLDDFHAKYQSIGRSIIETAKAYQVAVDSDPGYA